MFITKSTTNPDAFTCVIAHMDTCQNYKMQRKIYMQGNKILATYKDGTSAGLGADDSNGIFVALKLLKEIDNIKVLFTVEEETGGTGAQEAAINIDFFSDVMYLIQADRRGSHDLIVHTNGIDSASPDFIKRISSISKQYNYFNAHGTFTDVGILAEETRISGINVSCGYYHEHTEKEYTNYTELLNEWPKLYDLQKTSERIDGETIYTGGFYDEVLKMRDSYKARRNFLVKTFNDMGLETFKPQGAFYVFPCIRSTGLTSDEFCEKLLEDQKVACVPGTAFGPAGEGFIRVSYAYSLEELKVATEKIKIFVDKCRGNHD